MSDLLKSERDVLISSGTILSPERSSRALFDTTLPNRDVTCQSNQIAASSLKVESICRSPFLDASDADPNSSRVALH